MGKNRLRLVETFSINQAEREKIVYQAQQGVGEGEISAEKLKNTMLQTIKNLEILLEDLNEKKILLGTKHGNQDEIQNLEDQEENLLDRITEISEEINSINNLSQKEIGEKYNSLVQEKEAIEKEHQDYVKQKEEAKIKSKVSEKSENHFLTMRDMMKKKAKQTPLQEQGPSLKANSRPPKIG